MKELVYKFLDDYLGDEVYCKSESYLYFDGHIDFIHSSKNNSNCLIIQIEYLLNSEVMLFLENGPLCITLSSFFCIDYYESRDYLFDWFEDKFKIKLRDNNKGVKEYLEGIRIPPRPNSLRSVESPAPF